MSARRVLIYFAWSRPGETRAPLTEIDDRFPALFELRRLLYPKFEPLADPRQIDQGIGGFLDHVQKPNFATAPPHPFTRDGHDRFDSLLQSRPGVFPGAVLVCDTTLFSSTAEGLDSLERFWTRIVERPRRS